VENDELLLLLDGLDEVALERREACVQALNEFSQECMMPMVVCGRSADYESLTKQLKLRGAVLLQPLTSQQVNQYLADVNLPAVRKLWRSDTTLQELAEAPLMLSIMTLAYQGVSTADQTSFTSVEARRRHLFDAYMQQMFKRRRVDQPYSPTQTIAWIGWLAQRMTHHAQTVFLIENLQPEWLPTRTQQDIFRLIFRLIVGLLVGLTFGLLVGLLGLIWGGGEAVIKHYLLRFMLYRNGNLPWRLVPFLDYAAERIFLRKVGGGYIFVHRMLMEYFAELDTKTLNRVTSNDN